MVHFFFFEERNGKPESLLPKINQLKGLSAMFSNGL